GRRRAVDDGVGGRQAGPPGEEEGRRRHTQKTVLERKQAPTFDIVVEIETRDRFAVHHDVARVVDGVLRGFPASPEMRSRNAAGEVEISPPVEEPAATEPARMGRRRDTLHIYPYAVSEERLERAIRATGVAAAIARSVKDADLILTLRTYAKRQPPKLRDALARHLPVHLLRNSSVAQIEDFLQSL